MDTLIVVESHCGNTWRIAEAIASSIPDATVMRVDDAPHIIDPRVTTLIVGAPTHAFTLSTADSRESARQRTTSGAKESRQSGFHPSRTGLREWIDSASIPQGTRVAAFDTCVKGVGPLFGRAAKKANKLLAKKGIHAFATETFWVTGDDHLHDGELDRAAVWATAFSKS